MKYYYIQYMEKHRWKDRLDVEYVHDLERLIIKLRTIRNEFPDIPYRIIERVDTIVVGWNESETPKGD